MTTRSNHDTAQNERKCCCELCKNYHKCHAQKSTEKGSDVKEEVDKTSMNSDFVKSERN